MSFIMRLRIADFSANAFAFCESEAKVRRLLSRSFENRTRLQESSLAMLNVLYDDFGRECERCRQVADEEVVVLESSTGMTSIRLQTPQKAEKDLAKLTKALHEVNTKLIFTDNVAHFHVALGKFIKETVAKLEIVRQTRKLNPLPADVSQVLDQNMDYLINLAELRKYQAQSLHRRVQSQINVVSKTNPGRTLNSSELD